MSHGGITAIKNHCGMLLGRKIADSVGADKFFWASDFPHADHPVNYMEEIHELVEKMSPQGRRGILGENVSRALKLG